MVADFTRECDRCQGGLRKALRLLRRSAVRMGRAWRGVVVGPEMLVFFGQDEHPPDFLRVGGLDQMFVKAGFFRGQEVVQAAITRQGNQAQICERRIGAQLGPAPPSSPGRPISETTTSGFQSVATESIRTV